jgi:hypothetical protein
VNSTHPIELTPRPRLAVMQVAHLVTRTVCGLGTLAYGAHMMWTDPMLSPLWTVTNWTSVAIVIAGLWVLETVARDVHALITHEVTCVPILGTALTHRFNIIDLTDPEDDFDATAEHEMGEGPR